MTKMEENRMRLDTLCRKSHGWLTAASYNITKDRNSADELVSELYQYLAERVNPAIWWGENTFNLLYCHQFLKTRWINKIKSNNRLTTISPYYDKIEDEYDTEFDQRLETAYDEVIEELKRLEQTPDWVCSKIFQMYAFDDEMTLERLSNEISISKSTTFLTVKKAKRLLKKAVESPFTKD